METHLLLYLHLEGTTTQTGTMREMIGVDTLNEGLSEVREEQEEEATREEDREVHNERTIGEGTMITRVREIEVSFSLSRPAQSHKRGDWSLFDLLDFLDSRRSRSPPPDPIRSRRSPSPSSSRRRHSPSPPPRSSRQRERDENGRSPPPSPRRARSRSRSRSVIEEAAEVEEQDIAALMGFGGFGTTQVSLSFGIRFEVKGS